jgi:SAM-dependent methyltransferase
MQPLPSKQKKSHCPVCDSVAPEEFIDIHDVPLFCNLLLSDRAQALDTAKGNIKLLFCHSCGHVYNGAFDPSRMQYNPTYENPLHYSPTFQKYLVGLAQRLVATYDLHGKDIIEIGCGKCDFLSLLAEMGRNRCIGFDPSSDPQGIARNSRSNALMVIQDYFSEQYADYHADFIACRQVLEHVMEPQRFATSIRRAVDGKDRAVVFVEVPNVMFTLQKFGIWDLIYEHCGYFSTLSLHHLFVECGFNPLKVDETFGGQFIFVEARPSMHQNKYKPSPKALSLQEVKNCVRGFAANYRKTISKWEDILSRMRESGIKPVIWGAGSKGVTFLNVLKITDGVDYVVDLNPFKQGMYVPGSGQQIVAPELLTEIRPDVVIVMNPLYMNEIEEMITARRWDRNGKLLLMPAS